MHNSSAGAAITVFHRLIAVTLCTAILVELTACAAVGVDIEHPITAPPGTPVSRAPYIGTWLHEEESSNQSTTISVTGVSTNSVRIEVETLPGGVILPKYVCDEVEAAQVSGGIVVSCRSSGTSNWNLAKIELKDDDNTLVVRPLNVLALATAISAETLPGAEVEPGHVRVSADASEWLEYVEAEEDVFVGDSEFVFQRALEPTPEMIGKAVPQSPPGRLTIQQHTPSLGMAAFGVVILLLIIALAPRRQRD